MPARALIVEHERTAPGGLIRTWLDARGIVSDVLRIRERDDFDADPLTYGLVVSLGSESHAYDADEAWIPREVDLLRDAADADVPIIGICFGAQLLASALGGEVFRARSVEIGWHSIRTLDADAVREGPWFQWHVDTFTLPANATLLAESDAGPQAYVLGRSLGIQFHPEITPEIVETWVSTYPQVLVEHGIDAGSLLEETYRRAESSGPVARDLLERCLDRVSRGST